MKRRPHFGVVFFMKMAGYSAEFARFNPGGTPARPATQKKGVFEGYVLV